MAEVPGDVGGCPWAVRMLLDDRAPAMGFAIPAAEKPLGTSAPWDVTHRKQITPDYPTCSILVMDRYT